VNIVATEPDTAPRPVFPARWRWVADVLTIVVIAAFQIGGTYAASRHQTGRDSIDALAVGLLLVGPIALFWRHRYPGTVLAIASLASFVYLVLNYPDGPIYISMIAALYAVVVAGRRVLALVTLGIGYVSFVYLTHVFGRDPAPTVANMLGVAAWLLVLYAGCEAVRITRERRVEAARMEAEEARRKAGEERLNIAREVHDVVAHNISMINVQAGVALHLMHERPEQAEIALSAIKEASRETLRELRAVLGVLRAVDEEAPRAPTPGLDRLPELAQRARAAGVDINVEVEGEPRPLPVEVDLAAYRILQEALTNVARHAAGSHARVHVTYLRDSVVVAVDDDGRGLTPDATRNGGSGIVGMRERASALGGALEIGPAPAGGLRVEARLPADTPA
jgi:signal transduction histidine kinase